MRTYCICGYYSAEVLLFVINMLEYEITIVNYLYFKVKYSKLYLNLINFDC